MPDITPAAQGAALIIADLLGFASGKPHSVGQLQAMQARLTQLQAAVSDAELVALADEVETESPCPDVARDTFAVIDAEMARWTAGTISMLGLARLANASRALRDLAVEAQRTRPEMARVPA